MYREIFEPDNRVFLSFKVLFPYIKTLDKQGYKSNMLAVLL